MIREANQIHLNPPIDYIDGQTLTPMVRLQASISNPNTHEPLQQQRATDAAVLERALEAAAWAYEAEDWRGLNPAHRAQLLEKIASDVEKRLEDMALVESLTTGVVIRQTRMMMNVIPLIFRHVARQLQTNTRPLSLPGQSIARRPTVGPVLLLTPWSLSAVSAAQKVASALGAGCPVILQPSEWAPHAVGILAEVIHACGLPRGVFQLVHGDRESALRLAADPRIRAVSFTGDRATGRAIAQVCAADPKPAQLEMDGVNSFIVLEDADLDTAADGIVTALTMFNGQADRRLGRLLVHSKRYHALLSRVLARLETLQIDDSLSVDADMGPLIHAGHIQQVEEMQDHLLRCGGVAHVAGNLPDLPGYFMMPALITGCQPLDTLDEIGGPVAAVHFFKNEDEAAMLANQPRSGVMSYIFSADTDRATTLASRLDVAGVSINHVSLYGLHPQTARAAWGSSGLGDGSMLDSLRFFYGTRIISVANRDD